MLETDKIYYSYGDLQIVPEPITLTEHRAEGNPFLSDGFLPLFASPMTCVVNDKNYHMFRENKIHPIYPRVKDSLDKRKQLALIGEWAAFSLKEFKELFCNEKVYDEYRNMPFSEPARVLIDVANGHMAIIYDAVTQCKKIWSFNIEVMVGNIANPNTYQYAYQAGVDYVRLSVGTGFGCITCTQTGIGYPIASLIADTVKVRNEIMRHEIMAKEAYNFNAPKMPKIVADGGIRNYDDIAKALALGADYVMVGSVFAKMLESAGETRMFGGVVDQYDLLKDGYSHFHNGYYMMYVGNDEKGEPLYEYKELSKTYYGMASRQGQIDMGNEVIKTAEGTTKTLRVEYTMSGWVENFIDYIRSTMSYLDCREIEDISKAKVIIVSNSTKNSINK